MTKKWFKAAGMRAVKTVAQTAVATIGTSTLFTEVNWEVVISASILAGILSLLFSIKGLLEVEKGEKYVKRSKSNRSNNGRRI